MSTQPQSWIEDYFQLIAHPKANRTTLSQAYALKLQNLPRHLYRYRRADDRTMECLSTGLTWLSHPAKFNDPFDCSFSYSIPGLIQRSMIENLDAIMEQTGHKGELTETEIANIKSSPDPLMRMTELSFIKLGQQIPTNLCDILKEMSEARLANALDGLAAKAQESLRLCCLSETPSSILMWSHYADEHNGLCLEYDLQAWEKPRLLHLLHPVRYSAERYDATGSFDSNSGVNQLSPLAAACNKGIDWAYEQEWRVVVPGGALNHKPHVHLPVPARIIIGARADEGLRRQIQAIPRVQDVPIYKAQLSKTQFTIEV